MNRRNEITIAVLVCASLLSANVARAADVVAGVATQEAATDGGTLIRVAGHDYLMKHPRPGSVLVEIVCSPKLVLEGQPTQLATAHKVPTAAPPTFAKSDAPAPTKLEPATRSKAFVEQLAQGCAGHESFTFEERPNQSASEALRVREQTGAAKPATAKSLSPNVDPHVLPDSFGPDVQTGKQF